VRTLAPSLIARLRQVFTVELSAARIEHTAIFFIVGRIKIAAATLGDLNNGPVVLARDLHDEVVNAAGAKLPALRL